MKMKSLIYLYQIAIILLNILPETSCFSVPSSSATSDNNTPAPPTSSNKHDATYYTYKSMKRMEIPALLYSISSNLACKIFRRKPQTVPSSSSYSSPQPPRRVAIVTGSNTGVGYETAKSLVVDHGYEVIIASRSAAKGMRACESINQAAAAADLVSSSDDCDSSTTISSRGMAVWEGPLDLSDLDSVRSFAKRILENPKYNQTIDVLINNAGVNSVGAAAGDSSPCKTSPSEGQQQALLDVVFSTNFLGHFLLTNLLLDQCERVVNLSSVMHHFPVYSKNRREENDDDEDIESISFWKDKALVPSSSTTSKEASTGKKRKTYAPSKLAALLFTSELQRRYGNGKSIAVNPGAVFSDIWRNYPKAQQKLFQLLYLTPKQGCQTSVAAAVLDWNDDKTRNKPQDHHSSSDQTLYLQPYRLPPFGKKKAPFPVFEMLGPYKGYQVTTPRLPKDGGIKASQSVKS